MGVIWEILGDNTESLCRQTGWEGDWPIGWPLANLAGGCLLSKKPERIGILAVLPRGEGKVEEIPRHRRDVDEMYPHVDSFSVNRKHNVNQNQGKFSITGRFKPFL